MSKYNVSMVTSPLLVRVALCRMAEAAMGTAKYEILDAFNLPTYYRYCNFEVSRMIELLQQTSVLTINKIYVNDTIDLNPAFFYKNMTTRFGVHAKRVKFSSPKNSMEYINKWFETASLRRLPDVLKPGDINETTSIVLLSAVHVQTTWEECFNMFDTKTKRFRKFDGTTVKLPMMYIKGSFLFYHNNNLGFKIVSIPLFGIGTVMTLIADDRGGFSGIYEILHNGNLLNVARGNMKFKTVEVTLPRFRIKSTLDWNDALKNVGIQKIFDRDSGLERMLRSHDEVTGMYLSLVKQKVFLDVDEAGVFRVSGCASKVPSSEKNRYSDTYYKGSKSNKIQFVADRPFIFSIDLKVSPDGNQTQFLAGAFLGPDSEN